MGVHANGLFENGVLASFPYDLFNTAGTVALDLAIVATIVIVALELSRRIPRFGVPIAMIIIAITAGITFGGATLHLF